VASYLSAPTPSGSSAVNTCPQALQRNRTEPSGYGVSREYTRKQIRLGPGVISLNSCFRFKLHIGGVVYQSHGFLCVGPPPR
jgi:hypothetical protein